jgi:hypothetical protein
LGIDYEEMERYFEKMKEVFLSIKISYTKSSLMCLHMCHVLEIQADLHNSFSDLKIHEFCYFSHHLWEQITRIWREIVKNERGFSQEKTRIKKPPSVCYTCVMVLEIQADLYNSFFKNSPYVVKWDN